MSILVTGASGFLGASLLRHFKCVGIKCKGLYRSNAPCIDDISGSLNSIEKAQLIGVDCVVHCAGRAHVMSENSTNQLSEYRNVNVGGTLRLAQAASEAGVKRFIFISSIKVNGEQTGLGCPFSSADNPKPSDFYGVSKYEAEEALKDIAMTTGIEVVIIRPPLIYGPGMKGNLASISRLVDMSLPLPFARINNKRSLVGLDNLIDLIFVCTDHPKAANQTFLVSDGEDISTTQLFEFISDAKRVRLMLFSVPSVFMKVVLRLLGKKSMYDRLYGSLQVDISKTMALLDWSPKVSVVEGFRRSFGQP